jgi:hypothetical protein
VNRTGTLTEGSSVSVEPILDSSISRPQGVTLALIVIIIPLIGHLFASPTKMRLNFSVRGKCSTGSCRQVWRPTSKPQIVSVRVLLDPTLSANERLADLFAAAGANWEVQHSNTHLPFELTLWLPLTPPPGSAWGSVWLVALPIRLGLSLRLLDVSPRFAYSLSFLMPAGQLALICPIPDLDGGAERPLADPCIGTPRARHNMNLFAGSCGEVT